MPTTAWQKQKDKNRTQVVHNWKEQQYVLVASTLVGILIIASRFQEAKHQKGQAGSPAWPFAFSPAETG
jgi:hypothetical protein